MYYHECRLEWPDRRKTLIKKTIAMVIIAMLCAACAPYGVTPSSVFAKNGPKNKFKEPEVKFRVHKVNGVDVLDVHPSSVNHCPGVPGAGRGCVEFQTGTFGIVRLNMQGGNADKTCESTPQPAEYVIVEVKITDRGTGDKGVYPPSNPAPAWLLTAFPTLEAATGAVYQADAQLPSTDLASERAVFINLNNNDSGQGVKDLWYQVTVEDCNGGNQITSDPNVRNYGN